MNLGDISDAARLLRYALAPKQWPIPGSQYRELLDRYRTDVGFAEIAERVADGLGLDIHQTSQLGLLISGRLESPFAVTLENSGLQIRKSGDAKLQDRRCFGLVLISLVAHAYPNGEALIDTTNRPVRAAEVERFLERRIKTLADLDSDLGEPEDQLGEAANAWLDLPSVLYSDRGQLRRECRRWYIVNTLEFLVDTGRARREPALDDETGEAYVLNDRFRIGVADISESLIVHMSAHPAEAD